MSKLKGLFTSESMEWETPGELFRELDGQFHFTLDPCSTHENAKCARHYTRADDGLSKSWAGERVFCNPPYGREIGRWVKKCAEESAHALVVMLIPARTDTAYFHDYIYGKAQIRFIRGRLKFETGGVAQGPAPFPSMVVVFDSRETGESNGKEKDA